MCCEHVVATVSLTLCWVPAAQRWHLNACGWLTGSLTSTVTSSTDSAWITVASGLLLLLLCQCSAVIFPSAPTLLFPLLQPSSLTLIVSEKIIDLTISLLCTFSSQDGGTLLKNQMVYWSASPIVQTFGNHSTFQQLDCGAADLAECACVCLLIEWMSWSFIEMSLGQTGGLLVCRNSNTMFCVDVCVKQRPATEHV